MEYETFTKIMVKFIPLQNDNHDIDNIRNLREYDEVSDKNENFRKIGK